MIPLTPSLLVAAATALVGTGEEGGENRAPMVERFPREVQLEPGYPWCAAFVYHVGKWSHYDHYRKASSWPLPATASCKELAQFAMRNGVLSEIPMEGSVFLLATHATHEFHHTGVVATVDDQYATRDGDRVWVCTTIEGNTNDDGSSEGREALIKQRRFSTQRGDRIFVCTTIEGNTNDDGSNEGRETLIKQRTFSMQRGDRFIAWMDLDRPGSIAA